MDTVGSLVVNGVAFGRTIVGLLTRPYETYRHIAKYGKLGELIFVAILLACYFALASIVKVAAFRPFLLTQQFIVLFLGATSGAVVSIVSILFAGRLLFIQAQMKTIILVWSYTLIPTVVWFFVTSILFVLLPPPRTTSMQGIMFSFLFLVFSATLLWWKITLSYLALRFGLKLDLGKSLIVVALCAPILSGWAFLMYKAGVFKVPFL